MHLYFTRSDIWTMCVGERLLVTFATGIELNRETDLVSSKLRCVSLLNKSIGGFTLGNLNSCLLPPPPPPPLLWSMTRWWYYIKNLTVHHRGYLAILSGCTLLPHRLEFQGNAIQYKPQKLSTVLSFWLFPFTSLATGFRQDCSQYRGMCCCSGKPQSLLSTKGSQTFRLMARRCIIGKSNRNTFSKFVYEVIVHLRGGWPCCFTSAHRWGTAVPSGMSQNWLRPSWRTHKRKERR